MIPESNSVLREGKALQINGIDYCVTLFFDDENGEQIKELNFTDFNEVNHYIRENTPDTNKVSFSFREMIDGKPDSLLWKLEMEWKEFSEEEIQCQIEWYLQFLEESKAFAEKVESAAKEIHYHEINCDYEKKKSRLHEFVYICPNCLQDLEHCRCEHYPNYLVQIDKLMLPVIRELNINGYVTTNCCAGHPATDKRMDIYIAFDREYHFDMPFPDGGRYSKLSHILRYEPPEDMPREEYAAYQERVMEELLDWAEMLLPAEAESL